MTDELDERLGALGVRVHGQLDRSVRSGGDIDDIYHRRERHDRRRRAGVLAVAALVVVGVVALSTARSGVLSSERLEMGGGPSANHDAVPPPAGSTDRSSATTADSSRPPANPDVPVTTAPPRAKGYQLLFPFVSEAQAQEFQAAWKQGHQPWRPDPGGDPGPVALSFAAHLGFDEIDRVIATTLQGAGPGGRDAQVTVGYLNPNNEPVRVAVIHLVRLGSADDAPWEVVGTEDTLGLTLETPGYGSTVSSPVTVGGRITGVDESISIKAFTLDRDEPVGETAGVAAGGDNSPWSSTILVRTPGTELVTIVAVTGGHLARVERFAVTGVHVNP